GRLRVGGEELVHALRQRVVEALHLRDVQRGRGADALERAEVAEQRPLALLADAGNLRQHAAEVALAPQLAVEGDGEAVRLVAQPREQVQLAGVLAQHHRVLLTWEEDALRAALDVALHEAALLARAPFARDLRRLD